MAAEFRLIFRPQDYESSISFYRDGLELPIATSWDRGPDERGTIFQAAAGLIEILALPADWDYVPPQGLEIAYEVADVDAWYHRIRRKGLSIRGELVDKPWGHRAFSVTDPDGIKVVVFSVIE
jgi:catechol 2,3-dioxygenase-like lactoylglutathione lyase family enzyme